MKTAVCIALILVFCISGIAMAGEYYHIVKKGDTLWNLCQKYYGNPWLWPKLWEMNPFITNPHLLKPGDKINLLEDVPFAQPAAKGQESKKTEPIPAHAREVNWWEKGVDVSGITNVKSIGYFSPGPVDPMGIIASGDTERLILAERDKIVLRVDDEKVRPGDILWVYRSSEKIRDPVTREVLGFIISILGNVKITEILGDGLYNAIVRETYRDVRVGDMLTKYQPVSPCVMPVSPTPNEETEILATKDMLQIIGQFSVVYLRAGGEQGVKRGNLFQVFKGRVGLPDLPIGYVLVVDSRPDSAVGVVVEAKEHFYNGAKLRAVEWSKAPRYLSAIPSCS
ncbi:MAG: LysM peptidoglycan-binding domain-containing protein [Deltaproteobacteria bacterium]|nr:LysM peptidoglycan-binding domain-containing protein [Deltaproteobacteria bacterium]HDM10545.1 LysM peptidoglycan-binding domain-containing protein [Desulfobacteraceae bacterium]